VSRFDLLECAWDDSYDNRSNVVDVYIGYLRQKVDRTVWNRKHRDRTRLRLPAPNGGDRMNRLPIRWRLTLAFALALTVVLTAVAVYLHVQLSTDLDRDIERDLRTRAAQLSGLLMREPISRCPQQLLNLWNPTKHSPDPHPGWPRRGRQLLPRCPAPHTGAAASRRQR
jgi:hypothetical protein